MKMRKGNNMNDTMIYISGKISGTDDYMERFTKAEKELTEHGFSVINPAKMDGVLPKCCSHEDFMKIDLALLEMCERIYMLKGWEKSCGANREYGYALASDMTIMFE